MTLPTLKWTLDQYHQMIEAGVLNDCRVELLKGEIVQMSPEGSAHANRRIKAQDRLRQLLGDRAQVRPAAPITLPNGSEPEPDLAIAQPLEDEYDQHHPYPENIFWLIEYSNTRLDIDLGIKAEIYAGASIREYWVVNLKDSVLIVFRDPVNGHYRFRQELTQGSINPLAFPDIEVPIAKLLQ